MANNKPTYEELEQRVKDLENSLHKDLWLSNARLQIALNSLNIGIHEWDVINNLFIWDKRVYELVGLPYGAPVTQELLFQGIHPDDKRLIQNAFDSVFTNEKESKYFLQFRVIGIETGIERWVELTGQMFFEDDKASRFIGIIVDITDRKLAENQLKESKDFFELLFYHNPDAVSINRVSDGQYVDINEGFTNLLGFTRDEVLGKTGIELNISTTLDRDQKISYNFFKDSYYANSEIIIRRKDGKLLTCMVFSKIIDILGIPHFFFVIRDITERKQAEEALKESERVLKESQKIAGLGSFKINFNSGIWSCSEILDSIFGIDASYCKTLDGWFELIHPDWREMMVDYMQKEVIEKHNRFDKECLFIRKNDKKEIWIHSLGEPVFDKDDNLLYMVGTIQDITGRKHSELLIQQQNQELRELNATKDKLFSIVAHDLKGPVGSILTLNDLILLNLDDYEKNKIELIITQQNNVLNQTYKLLENLLDWSRLQNRKMVPDMQKTNLKAIVEDTFMLTRELAMNKDIMLHNLVEADTFVKCDKEMTKTILRNLVSNAIKFTNNRGIVSISAYRNDFTVVVQVKDTGVGIPPAIIPDLFCIEKNITTYGTAREKGTGLGLLLCKELIEKQGGKIWIESEVEKGSIFYFTIPYHNDFGG